MRDPSAPPPHACGATKRDGQPCPMPPMRGQKRCRMHGGQAPRAMANGAKNYALAKARQSAASLIVAYDGEVSGDPLESLMRMVQTAAWAERAYATLIDRELQDRVLVEVGSLESGYHEEPHPYVKLWNEERDRLAKFAKVALDAGVDAKQVKLAEQQAEISISVMLAVMQRLNLSADLMARAPLLAAEEFERLA